MEDVIDHGVLMLADFPIFGDYEKRQQESFNSADLINLFLIQSDGGKKKFAFVNSPGLKSELVVEQGGVQSRALFVFNNYMYGVFGASVYRFTPQLTASFLGSIGTSSGYVSIAVNNNSEIIFVDGQAGYLFKTSDGTFAKITATGFPPKPLNVVSLDGYFAIPLGETRTYQISALNDGTKWTALDEAQIAAYPGLNVGVGVVNRRLFFFKTDSVEVWYNAGAANFPFRRDNNLLFNYGCLATSSIVSGFGMLFWLAKDADGVGSVMMTTGQEPIPVSDPSVVDLISTFTNPYDVSAFIYKQGDHIFLQMNWTIDDVTLVYDVTMKTWGRKEMQKKLPILGEPYSGKVRHLADCHAFFNNQHYIGSYKKPIIYSLSRDYATNAGEPIRRVRTSKHFFDGNYRMLQINHIQYDMQTGIGTDGDPNDAQKINPQAYLSLARDGQPFGNEAPAPIGKIGNTRSRVIFRKKGQARDIVARFSTYAPLAPIVILGASIDYEVLNK